MGQGISKQQQKMSLSWIMRSLTQQASNTPSLNEITASIYQRTSRVCRKTFSRNNSTTSTVANNHQQIDVVIDDDGSIDPVVEYHTKRTTTTEANESMYDTVKRQTNSVKSNNVQTLKLDITDESQKTYDKCKNDGDCIVKDGAAARKNNSIKRECINKRPNIIIAKDSVRDNEYVVVVVVADDDGKHNELVDSSYGAVKTYNYQLNGQSRRPRRRSRRENGCGAHRGEDQQRFGYEIQNVDEFLSNVRIYLYLITSFFFLLKIDILENSIKKL